MGRRTPAHSLAYPHSRHAVTLDREQLPRTAQYLDSLPEGLESFSDARAKASIYRTVYKHGGDAVRGLPEALQARLDNPESSSAWIPASDTLALIIALVESQGLEGEEESRFIRDAARALFATPMYRILMWAATPRLLFKGAGLRWSAFFRGCKLVSTVRERDADVFLEAPPGLFTNDLAKIFEDVLRSAVKFTEEESTGARIDLVHFSPSRIHYLGAW